MHGSMGIVGLLFASALLAGCADAAPVSPPPSKANPAAPPPAQHHDDATDLPALPEGGVRLERGPCFGRCPQYVVEIDAAGAVHFEGVRNVVQAGVQTGVADPAALGRLRRLLREPRVRALRDIYRPGEAGCGVVATDMPGAVIDWRIDGERHHVQHYLGCTDAPRLLSELAEAIDDASGAGRWVRQGAER